MYAVGRLGTLISQVSAPFHPFGGAVDIVVVEQQDGTFKSSPWYVRFGKFQGVLKAREKVVDINVNGEDASFHMYLDHTGGAYFLREVDAEEGDAILSPTFSGEEMEAQDRRPMKAKSWNYGDDLSDAVTQLEVSNGKVMSRRGSRRARFLGLGFGRKSMKENKFEEEEDGGGVVRVNSLECAEMAADLLEMKWSTNLGSVRKKKEDGSHLSAPDILDGVESKAEMLDEDGGLLDSGVSKVENRAIKCQSTIYYETLDTPRIELDNFGEQVNETTLLSCSKSGEVLVQEETSPDPELVTVRRLDDSTKEVLDSCSTLTASSFSDSISQVQDGRSIEELDEMKRLCPFCDPQEVCSDVRTKVINNSSSVGLEEEQFLFSDLDDIKLGEVKCTEVVTSDGIKMMNEYFHSDFSSDSFPEKFVHTNLSNDGEELREEAEVISNQINISKSNKFAGEELRAMVRSCPNTRSHFDELDENLLHRPLGHSLDSSSKSLKWAMLRENVSSCIKSDAGSVHHLSNSQPSTEDALNLEELKNVDNSAAVADSPKIVETASGSWSIWPFGYNRSRSMKDTKQTVNCTRKLDAEIALEGTVGVDLEKEVPKPKANKKKVRAISPTSEQLASLNLKEGKNIVTFTFSTAMLGKQQVDARIYLWRWDTRVVITDVDGTITKSDVLGQFMPLVGKDWSQTGVAHLFSAIKENGYQLLFLSARAISQAGLTRQFLFNLKQDGKGLPDGPVVISPDGLFPSLFREVIRRAPHEFKIACLEDIKACFPSERNPFYAGFGNRDTDEFSYLKVGIPKGKIFIINPKGVVVVNRCNKSYTSLHALVNGMFPPTLSSEQEDFNSWNFWKLPPPLIDI